MFKLVFGGTIFLGVSKPVVEILFASVFNKPRNFRVMVFESQHGDIVCVCLDWHG